MKPPMRQEVISKIPVLDEDGKWVVNKYGKPKTEEIESKARVQFKSQLIADAQGRERQVNLEIDLPSEFNPDIGTELTYKTIAGDEGKGTIVNKEESTNISGSKVYFRTVFVDG